MAQFSVAPGFYLVAVGKEKASSEEITVAIDSTKYPHARQGTILAVGGKFRRDGEEISPLYQVGDEIVYRSYGFEELVNEGKKLHFVSFDSVLAKLAA